MRAEAMLHACEPVMFLQVNAISVLVRTLVLQTRSRWFEPARRRTSGASSVAHHAAVELINGGRIADAQFPRTARVLGSAAGW
jgi:hypothetical protein